ncbi:fumarylacetoacetate hydrolase family protein [bacterium]|nr:fumarylacetoacetate hydrolase family protein [bacterium]
METVPLFLAPKRVVALGLTWRDHARETGERISPEGPARFERDPASLSQDGRVLLPTRARVCRTLDALEPGLGGELARRDPDFPILLDYEVELAFVALEGGRIGWFLANDVTVRTVQVLGEGSPNRMAFWSASKSFPSTLVVGLTMAISDGPPDLELVLRVGGQERQRARSTEMLYTAAELRGFAGPLAPGDVVLTGTPAGVALSVPRWKRALADLLLSRWGKLGAAFRASRKNSRFLHAGDVLDMDAGLLGRARAVVEEEREV